MTAIPSSLLQDHQFQDVTFIDPKFKHEIYMRIDVKQSYFSNYFIFPVVEIIIELIVVCQKLIILL